MGLTVAVEVTEKRTALYGDINLMSEIWKLQAEKINTLAEYMGTISSSSNLVESSVTKALLELSRDLKSAPSGGYGDIEYWKEKIYTQDRILSRVGDRISELHKDYCGK